MLVGIKVLMLEIVEANVEAYTMNARCPTISLYKKQYKPGATEAKQLFPHPPPA